MIYLIIVLFLLPFAVGGLLAAPWFPTKRSEIKRIREEVDLKDGMVVYDLGCGDGRVLFELIKKNPKIIAIGSEIAFWILIPAYLRKWLGGRKYKNVHFKVANFYKQDLSDADIVFVFLREHVHIKLQDKFKKELKDDCLVVAAAWPVGDIEPQRILEQKDCLPIFVYQAKQLK